MGKPAPTTLLSNALHLVQVAAALTILVLVPWKLYRVDVDLKDITAPSVTTECLLDPGNTSDFLPGSRFCVAIIAFAVATLILGTIASFAKCLCSCMTMNVCGLSNFVTVAVDIALAVAWGVAFALLVVRGNAATDAGFPNKTYRDGVIAAGFFGCISYVLDAIVNVVGVAMSLS